MLTDENDYGYNWNMFLKNVVIFLKLLSSLLLLRCLKRIDFVPFITTAQRRSCEFSIAVIEYQFYQKNY